MCCDKYIQYYFIRVFISKTAAQDPVYLFLLNLNRTSFERKGCVRTDRMCNSDDDDIL